MKKNDVKETTLLAESYNLFTYFSNKQRGGQHLFIYSLFIVDLQPMK